MKSSQPDNFRVQLKGYLLVVGAAACWGASGIWVKFIELSTNPSATALAFWRDLATFLVLLGCGLISRPSGLKIKRSALPHLIGMGACLGAFHIFYNLGVMLNGVAITTVQQAAMPAFVTLAACFLWKEKLSRLKLVAMALTFLGTVLTTGLASGAVFGEVTFWGVAAGFCIPMLYAGWTICGKQVQGEYHALVVLTYAFGIASLMLLPLQPFVRQPSQVGLEAVAYFSGFILISSVGGFMLFITGLGKIPAGNASITAMSEIVFVVIFAFVLLGEVLKPAEVLGAALVTAGVLLIVTQKAAPE